MSTFGRFGSLDRPWMHGRSLSLQSSNYTRSLDRLRGGGQDEPPRGPRTADRAPAARNLRPAFDARGPHATGTGTTTEDRDCARPCSARAKDPGNQAEAASLTYRRSERTTLFLETHEGDTVRLKIMTRESMAVDAAALEDGDVPLTALQVQARASTRVALFVNGDLSTDELDAIRSVVEQAGALAQAFFAGGAHHAFDAAAALDVDAAQLASIGLRLEVRQQLTYSRSSAAATPLAAAPSASEAVASARLAAAAAQPAAPNPAAARTTEASAAAARPWPGESVAGVAHTAPEPTSAPEGNEPAVLEETAVPPMRDLPATEPAGATARREMVDMLGVIADFLHSLIGTFDDGTDAGEHERAAPANAGTLSLALKLRIFESVLFSVSELGAAPEHAALPPLVPRTLEAVAAQRRAPLDQRA